MNFTQKYTLKDVTFNLLIVVLYILFAKIGLAFALQSPSITIFWPAGGFAFAVLLLGGLKYLPAIFIGGVIAGFIGVGNLWSAVALGVADALESYIAYWLTTHYFHINLTLTSRQDFWKLTLIVGVIASTVSALVAATALLIGNIIPASLYLQIGFRWWMGDVLGIAFLTPLILIWSTLPKKISNTQQLIEIIALFSLAVLMGLVEFFDWFIDNKYTPHGIAWVIMIIALSGLRHGRHSTAVLQLVFFTLALWSASHNIGHYADDMVQSGLFNFWLFGMVSAIGGLTVAVMRDENERIQTTLKDNEERLALATTSNGVGVWDWDLQTLKMVWDDSMFSLYHRQRADFTGGVDAWEKSLHPDDRKRSEQEVQDAISGKKPFDTEFRVIWPNGEERHIKAVAKVFRDENGKPLRMLGTNIDITDHMHLENARMTSEQRFHDIVNTADGIVWEADATTFNFTYISQKAESMLGYSVEDWKQPGFWVEHLHPDDKNWAPQYCASCTSRIEAHNFEYRFIAKDGRTVWLHDIVAVVEEAGQPRWLRGLMVNITERKQAESELDIAAIAFESQEGKLVSDAEGTILRVNNAFTRITGYSAEEVIGKNPSLLHSGHHDDMFYAEMWSSINSTGAWDGEIWNRRKNGEIYPEHLTITAVKDAAGLVVNYVGTLTDITQSKAASEEIKNLAFFDPLTQLPNRRLLIDRLNQALASSTRSGHRGALLFMDLDHFKNLNDSLGHDIGDLLLQQVAARLVTCVRECDTVARIGGDEFVVLLELLNEEELEAAKQAETICNKILNALNQPYKLDLHVHRSSPSIGVTLYNNHDASVETLLKQADVAMYEAKASGRNAFRFFDPKMQEKINTRMSLELELRQAIELQQFQLYYQIQVDDKGNPLGAEALIRWLHPERGLISPFSFIPLAEDTSLIYPIGQWVLDMACAQLKRWEQNTLTRHLTLSVNVSAKQFHQADFVEKVQETVKRHAINPNLLNLELTESMLLEDVDNIIVTMNTLREIGIRFELDDFGTGYSSLQYLKQLPLYQLKIDQSFVRDIAIDSSDRALVRTIITMTHSLDLKVIAEGVETNDQWQFLKNNNCDHYQGYLFGKPVPIDEFERLLDQ